MDYYSSIPLSFMYHAVINIISPHVINKERYVLFIILSILSNMVIDVIKKIEFKNNDSIIYKITRRPKDAINCDLLSRNGKHDTAKGGLPSGHVNSAVFYALFMMSHNNTSKSEKVLYILIPIIMGIVRYYKKCHTIIQIFAGAIFGCFTMGVYKLLLLYKV
jgi:membrane-associated phospholipid phosphatase